jgi:hypothetical protein
VPAQALGSGSSITVYAITRDTLDNFGANVAADAWSLQNSTGGVVPADLVPAGDRKSAVFTAHAVGTANILATSGAVRATGSGLITVTPPTGVAEGTRPLIYALDQNFPNPFNPETRITYSVPAAGNVLLTIYDALGREVATLVQESKPPGEYSVVWSAHAAPSGVYFVRFVAGNFAATKKMVLMK